MNRRLAGRINACTGRPTFAATVGGMMIDAPSLRKGSAYLTVKYDPLKLMLTISANNASSLCSSGANLAMPALTKRMSTVPNLSFAFSNNAVRSFELITSVFTPTAFSPRVWTASSSVLWSRPAMTTLAPLAINSLAVASPIPLLPPVITATSQLNLLMISTLSFKH